MSQLKVSSRVSGYLATPYRGIGISSGWVCIGIVGIGRIGPSATTGRPCPGNRGCRVLNVYLAIVLEPEDAARPVEHPAKCRHP